jgi:hypothetical protein
MGSYIFEHQRDGMSFPRVINIYKAYISTRRQDTGERTHGSRERRNRDETFKRNMQERSFGQTEAT